MDLRSFVDGLKSRIKSEISLLLALEESTSGEMAASEEGALGGSIDGFNTSLRKFLPLPLLKGVRH